MASKTSMFLCNKRIQQWGILFPVQSVPRCYKQDQSRGKKKKKNISLVKSPKLGSTPRHTDWLTVSCKVTLTLTDWLTDWLDQWVGGVKSVRSCCGQYTGAVQKYTRRGMSFVGICYQKTGKDSDWGHERVGRGCFISDKFHFIFSLVWPKIIRFSLYKCCSHPYFSGKMIQQPTQKINSSTWEWHISE
jgi:hypothetical protein